MAELKTKATRKSAVKYIRNLSHEGRRQDAEVLLELFQHITGKDPVIWGDSIVGFGRYHYEQRSGQAASWPVTGFSPRKQQLVIYIMPGFDNYQTLLDKLGKHRHARSCLYINKLADVDLKILERLISRAYREMGKRYPCD